MKVSKIFTGRTLLVAVLAVMGVVSAWADDYTGPQITSFYPMKVEDNPTELKSSMKAYVYFTSGSKIEWAKAHVIMNGETIGDCIYKKGKTTINNSPVMDQKDPDNVVFTTIGAGQFTISFYGVSWVVDGETLEWEDPEACLGDVTYSRKGTTGTIVSESGIEDGKILSYYPADSEDGLLTLTFSKPVVQGSPKAQFTYGGNDVPLTIPVSQSEDGLQLTVDFRGHCYNVDALAPGVVFKDDNGEVVDPPKSIGFGISGLQCTDGTSIQTDFMGHAFEGRKYYDWEYEDITLPNPVLTKAEFFASSNPDDVYLNINGNTDKMNLYVENASSLASADILLEVGTVSATIPFAEITVGNDCYTVTLPAAVKSVGSSGLKISLVNCEFVHEDGAPHVIAPLTFSRVANEFFSIAELKQAAEGTDVVLIASNVRITFSNADLVCTFGEDETAGIQFITEDNSQIVFAQGALINGRIVGKYLGGDLFSVNLAKSEYEATEADIKFGKVVNTLDALVAPENQSMLLTLVFNDALSAELADETTLVIQDGSENVVVVPTDYIEGLTLPTDGYNMITGVATSMGDYTPFLLMRNADDLDYSDYSSVEINSADQQSKDVIYNIEGTKVEKTSKGIYIINGKKVVVK